MKKVFLLLVAAVFSLLSANAQKENDLVISAGDSKQLILGGNMNVVLVMTNPQANNVELSKEFLQKLYVERNIMSCNGYLLSLRKRHRKIENCLRLTRQCKSS